MIAWFALVAIALPGWLHLDIDSSAERFVVDDPETAALALDARRHFGRGQAIRVMIEGDRLWTRETLVWLETVERDATRLRGVTRAAGLAGRHAWRLPDWPPDDPAAFADEVRIDPFDRGAGFVDDAAEAATLWIGLAGLALEDRRATLDALDALLATAPDGLEVRRVGLPILARALDRGLLDALRWVLPLTALASLALLVVAFRRGPDIVSTWVGVVTVEVVVFGLFGHLGGTLDIVSSILAPVLYVVVLAMGVHVQGTLRLVAANTSATEAIVETWKRKAAPVLWTGVTTAVGFGSLATSPLAPIRQLGLWAAFGLLVGTAFTLFVMPAWVATVTPSSRPHPTRFEHRSRSIGRRWATLAIEHRRVVVLIMVGLTGFAGVGMGRLELESDLRHLFDRDATVSVDLDAFAQHGLGGAAVDLFLRPAAASAPRFDTPSADAWSAALADALRADPGVAGVVGFADLVSSVERRVDGSAREMIATTASLDAVGRRFVARSGDRARLTVGLHWQDAKTIHRTLDRLDEVVHRHLDGSGWTADWTGSFVRVLDIQEHLTATLLRSTVLTLVVVAVVFGLLLGPNLAVRALVPNLLPGLLTLGALGWVGVPIDSTLVLHVSIILGLAVDDTLHTLSRFVTAEADRAHAAVIEAIDHTASAHIATSGLLVIGFGIWALTEILPIARFGLVSASAVGLVLIADLIILPALLVGAPAAARARARRRFDRE
ncbi:MAG: MMPL family transporter [Acidobacteriota bacterium]